MVRRHLSTIPSIWMETKHWAQEPLGKKEGPAFDDNPKADANKDFEGLQLWQINHNERLKVIKVDNPVSSISKQ